MLFCLILTLFTAGTLGLSIYFDKTRASTSTSTSITTTSMNTVSVTAPSITKKEPDAKEVVLILNTAMNSNVAMVITSTGEFHLDFFICARLCTPRENVRGHQSHGRLSYFLSFLDAYSFLSDQICNLTTSVFNLCNPFNPDLRCAG